MNELIDDVLVPGRVLAITLLDSRSRAVLLPAGTVLTPELIAQLHRTNLAVRAALCVGEEVRELAPPEPTYVPPPIEFERRRRMHESLSSLRMLLAVGALGAGLFAMLAGDLRDAQAALAAVGLLVGAFLASMQMASRTRTILKEAREAQAARLGPGLMALLEGRAAASADDGNTSDIEPAAPKEDGTGSRGTITELQPRKPLEAIGA